MLWIIFNKQPHRTHTYTLLDTLLLLFALRGKELVDRFYLLQVNEKADLVEIVGRDKTSQKDNFKALLPKEPLEKSSSV